MLNEKKPRKLFGKKYLKYLLLLIFVAGLVGYKIINKDFENMTHAIAEVQLTATQLFTDYENDEEQANTKYLDKIVEVEGVVKELSTDENGMTSLTLESGSDMFGVICQLDNLTKHQRTNFKEGEKIKIKGICTGVLMDVVLVRCVEV